MKSTYFAFAVLVAAAMLASSLPAAQTESVGLVVYGDVVNFLSPKDPNTCVQNSRFKRGESVGFRMTAINPATGNRDRASQLVVHVTFGGNTMDLPMHDRQNDRSPEREFWIAKWTVPADAPVGIVRFTGTAKDPQGHTGEYKPFQVDASQLTIVE